MNINMSIFAKRLKIARLQRDIKQKELAEKIGVRSATVSAYENENESKRATPSLENAIAIAKELNVSLDYLCGLEDLKKDETLTGKVRAYLHALAAVDLFSNSYSVRYDTVSETQQTYEDSKYTEEIKWHCICFRQDTPGCDFLKGIQQINALRRTGALDDAIHAAVVDSLCDRYAPEMAAQLSDWEDASDPFLAGLNGDN